MRRFSLRLILLLGGALPVSAQSPVLSDSLCTYDTCALRIESFFFGGTRIVRGADGEQLGRFGLFGSDLSEAVASSERALVEARAYESRRAPASLSGVGGSVLLALSIYLNESPGSSDALETGALVGGFGLSFLSIHFSTQAQRSRARAVWWYNRDLPR